MLARTIRRPTTGAALPLRPGDAASPLTVVCWKWRSPTGYRSTFTAEHVNTLARMVERHYARPHRVVCVTDDAEGIDPAIGIVPLWRDLADVVSPHGPKNPSCYRRLRMFDPAAAGWFGRRFVSLDLDTVIVGDVAPLWDRGEDIVLFGDTNPANPYNGSMILHRAGTRPQLWADFDPESSPRQTRAAGLFGSDQAWIGLKLGAGEARWGKLDGVFSYRCHIQKPAGRLPAVARLVNFHGAVDPWSPEAQRLAWVRDNYR